MSNELCIAPLRRHSGYGTPKNSNLQSQETLETRYFLKILDKADSLWSKAITVNPKIKKSWLLYNFLVFYFKCTKCTHNAAFYAFLENRSIFLCSWYLLKSLQKHFMSYTIMFGMTSGIHFWRENILPTHGVYIKETFGLWNAEKFELAESRDLGD